MKVLQGALIAVVMLVVLYQQVGLTSMVQPVMSNQSQMEKSDLLREAAIKAGIGDPGGKIAEAIRIASRQTKLSESFLLSLMYSESSFNRSAVSSKNYQGLMQIPQKVHYEDANCIIGARIFLEKLAITKGDYRKAIILYKGWPIGDPNGGRQADRVITLARKINEV